MLYYDSKGNIKEFVSLEKSSEGTTATIYKGINGIAYKKYFDDENICIKQSMFELLKSIDNPNFIKLIERYYIASSISDYNNFIKSISNTTPNFDIFSKDQYRISLYTYYWIQKEYIDILEEDKNYLLENLNELIKLANILSRNHVKFSDMKVENCVCNKNSIVLIDPDLYYFSSGILPYEKNRVQILFLISQLCKNLTRHKSPEISKNIKELFADCYEKTNSSAKILSKKLKGYQKPIDYLNR